MRTFIAAILMAFVMSVSAITRDITDIPKMTAQSDNWDTCVAQTAVVVLDHYINQKDMWTPDQMNIIISYNVGINCGVPGE